MPCMRKYGKILKSQAGHRWQYGTRALHAGRVRLQIHTARCVEHWFSTAKIVARTALNITLHVLYIACLVYLGLIYFRTLFQESNWGVKPGQSLTQNEDKPTAWLLQVEASWSVMAHAQKPDFVFRRNGRVHLNRRRHQFSRLLAAEVCASEVVMLDKPCSEVVWGVLTTHSIR